MTTATGARGPIRNRWIVLGFAVGVLLAAYAVWAGWLAMMASQGSLPPSSRIPDLPVGARVVSDTQECGSGGCWWELKIQPPAGQSPAELARAMGIVTEARKGWRILDPHSIAIGSQVSGDTLTMYVRY
jgi:hypothetical protein